MHVVTSNSVPSCSSTWEDRLSKLETLATIHLPIRSPLMAKSKYTMQKTLFSKCLLDDHIKTR